MRPIRLVAYHAGQCDPKKCTSRRLGRLGLMTFVHRWVLMAAGVGSGIGWAALMMSTGNSIRRMSSGFK